MIYIFAQAFQQEPLFQSLDPFNACAERIVGGTVIKQNINANIWNEVTVKQCWNLI